MLTLLSPFKKPCDAEQDMLLIQRESMGIQSNLRMPRFKRQYHLNWEEKISHTPAHTPLTVRKENM